MNVDVPAWCSLQLEDFFVHVIGGDWGKDENNQEDGLVKVSCIRGSEFKNWKTNFGSTAVIRKIKASSLVNRKLEDGDILIEISGGGPEQPVGRTVLITEKVLKKLPYPSVCTNFLRLARSRDDINSSYLNYYLNQFYLSGEVTKYQGGSNNLRNLKFKEFSKINVPLSPLAEQKVIADKLDTLLAQVEITKARLDRIPDILKRFRQSVLAAAVSGKLTEEWRLTYQKPDDWRTIVLSEAANIIDPHPSHRTPQAVKVGVPYIGIGDLKDDGSIDFENSRKVSFDVLKEHNERYTLKEGDFVFGKIGTLGKATVLPININYTLSANVILIQPLTHLAEPKYLEHFLSSPSTMNEIAKQANSTSQAAFGIKKMRSFECKLPHKQEQTEIVRRVEELFDFANHIEQKSDAALARVNRLTQSILAKAFRGELTTEWRAANQDLIRGENSAEALLKKIKTEREKLGAKPQRTQNRAAVSKQKSKGASH